MIIIDERTNKAHSSYAYLLDGEPILADDLFIEASKLNEEFANSVVQHSSEAARILREHGHTVENTQSA